MTEARRRLIVNADDFGMSPGVTRGIREAIAAGTVTSISVMVNFPDWEDTAVMLRALARDVSVGLHLNLTTGTPLAPAPSTVADRTGSFLPFRVLALRAVTGQLRCADLDAEIDAQIARFAATGVELSHLDGHEHVHLLPVVCDRVAARTPVSVRCRLPVEPVLPARDPPRVSMKKIALRVAARRTAASRTLSSHVHFRGLSLYGARDHLAALLGVLDTLPAGVTELMVHPGHADAELRTRADYVESREDELRSLVAPVVRERIADLGIQLASFGAGV